MYLSGVADSLNICTKVQKHFKILQWICKGTSNYSLPFLWCLFCLWFHTVLTWINEVLLIRRVATLMSTLVKNPSCSIYYMLMQTFNFTEQCMGVQTFNQSKIHEFVLFLLMNECMTLFCNDLIKLWIFQMRHTADVQWYCLKHSKLTSTPPVP